MRILIVILILTFFSCKKEREITPVEYFYSIKTERLKYEKLEECKADAIEEAEKFVDVLIDKWIKTQSTGDEKFPAKPNRPRSPEKIIGHEVQVLGFFGSFYHIGNSCHLLVKPESKMVLL